MSVLYHLTDESHLASILEFGLIPQLGCNCEVIGDNRKAIFLCSNEDIGKWHIILSKNVLLEVSGLCLDKLESFDYSSYREYMFNEAILARDIKVVTSDIWYTYSDMYELCESYLYFISNVCVRCARYYTSSPRDVDRYTLLKYLVRSLISVLPKLNYDIAFSSVWRKCLVEYGESGEYSFCDSFGNSSNRLWQQLIYYDQDDLQPLLVQLYEFIDRTFPFAKDLCTGGFTYE